jgi:ribosomal protein S18 acetylase RimI-like enzyme
MAGDSDRHESIPFSDSRSPRAGTPADAPEMARLRYEFRRALGAVVEPEAAFVDRCARWMSARLSGNGSWRCWVADGAPAGRLAGTIWLQIIEKIPNPVDEPELHGYVTNLYVRPELRGRGLATALLTVALAACDAHPLDAVLLWPSAESRTLYERHGFTVSADLMERRHRP